MSSTEQETARRKIPWGRVICVASVALNLLVIGMVAGAVVMHDRWDGPRHRPHAASVTGPLTHALDPDDRHDIGRELRRMYRRDAEEMGRLHEAFNGLSVALVKTPFDREEVAEILQRQRLIFVRRLERGHQVLLVKLEQMSDKDRAAYAERLQEQIEHHAERRRHHRDDD